MHFFEHGSKLTLASKLKASFTLILTLQNSFQCLVSRMLQFASVIPTAASFSLPLSLAQGLK